MKNPSMLASLAKQLGLVPEPAVVLAANVSDEVTASLEQLKVEMAEAKAAADSQIAELSAAFETAAKAVAAADEKVAEMQAALEAAVAAKAESEKIVADMKVSARKAKIVDAVGEAQAESILAATEGLDDTKFGAVLQAFGASFKKESESAMFTEAGVAGLSDGSVVEESEEAKLLRAKYSPKSAK